MSGITVIQHKFGIAVHQFPVPSTTHMMEGLETYLHLTHININFCFFFRWSSAVLMLVIHYNKIKQI